MDTFISVKQKYHAQNAAAVCMYSICRANSSSFFPRRRRHRHHTRERRFWVAFLNKRWLDLSYSMISVECKWSLMIKKMAPFFSFDKFQKMDGMNKFKEKVFFTIFHFENFSPNFWKIFRSEKIKLIKYQLIDIIWIKNFVSINIFKNLNYHDIIGNLWRWSESSCGATAKTNVNESCSTGSTVQVWERLD